MHQNINLYKLIPLGIYNSKIMPLPLKLGSCHICDLEATGNCILTMCHKPTIYIASYFISTLFKSFKYTEIFY